jgi:hypothetical protein
MRIPEQLRSRRPKAATPGRSPSTMDVHAVEISAAVASGAARSQCDS